MMNASEASAITQENKNEAHQAKILQKLQDIEDDIKGAAKRGLSTIEAYVPTIIVIEVIRELANACFEIDMRMGSDTGIIGLIIHWSE